MLKPLNISFSFYLETIFFFLIILEESKKKILFQDKKKMKYLMALTYSYRRNYMNEKVSIQHLKEKTLSNFLPS